MATTAPKDQVGIYYPNDPLSHSPRFFVPRASARDWRNLGLGSFVNKAKGLQLRFTPKDLPDIRGISCTMKERVFLAFVSGKAWAKAAVEGWA